MKLKCPHSLLMKEKNKNMSKKKGKTNLKIAALNELNSIDKKIKRFKNDEEKVTTLTSKRKTLTNKLKTKRK